MQPQVDRPRTKVLVVQLRAKHALPTLASPMLHTVSESVPSPLLHIGLLAPNKTNESFWRSFLAAQ